MIPVSSQHRKIEIMRKIKNSSTAFICLGQELKSHSQSMELQVGNHSHFMSIQNLGKWWENFQNPLVVRKNMK